MSKVNIHDAKTRLSRYVEEASLGKEIIIAKAGKPVARITPLTAIKVVRKLGLVNGKVCIPDDFNTPLPDMVLAEFLSGEQCASCLTRIFCFGQWLPVAGCPVQ